MSEKSGSENLENNETVFLVNHFKTICKDEGISFCFLVKEADDGAWTYMDKYSLRGLEMFKWGNVYQVKAIRNEIDPPLEDRPSAYYSVKEIQIFKENVSEDFEIPLRDNETSYLEEEDGDFYILGEVKVNITDLKLRKNLNQMLGEEKSMIGRFRHGNKEDEIQLIALVNSKN